MEPIKYRGAREVTAPFGLLSRPISTVPPSPSPLPKGRGVRSSLWCRCQDAPQVHFFHLRRRVSVLVLMSSLALLAGCAPPGPRALLKGKNLIEAGKYAQAIAKLET